MVLLFEESTENEYRCRHCGQDMDGHVWVELEDLGEVQACPGQGRLEGATEGGDAIEQP